MKRLCLLLSLLLYFSAPSHAQKNKQDVNALNKEVVRLYRAGKYAEAIIIAKRHLAITEQKFGPDHADTATSLNNLALIYDKQGNSRKAEKLYRRTIKIYEKALGLDHPKLGISLSNLGTLHYQQGRYTEAESLYLRSLNIKMKAHGAIHSDVGISLLNLAELYRAQSRFDESERVYKSAISIIEKTLGLDHYILGNGLANLAVLYKHQDRYTEAEQLTQRSLNILEKSIGPDHPKVGHSLINLAEIYQVQGRYTEAELLYKRTISIFIKAFTPDHYKVGFALNTLGEFYKSLDRIPEAEALLKRSLIIYKKSLGHDHYFVSNTLDDLASLYSDQGLFSQAEPLYKSSLNIREKTYGLNHPKVASSLHNLAAMYFAQNRLAEAVSLNKRSLKIFEKVHGQFHLTVATSLNNLAQIYSAQSRYAEAEPLLNRSLNIREKVLSSDHMKISISLNNLALLYSKIGNYKKAEKLYNRSLKISEKALGPDHPNVGKVLINLAGLYEKLKRPDDEAFIRARLTKMPERGTRYVPLYFITNRLAKEGGGYGISLSANRNLGRIVMQVPEAEVQNRAKRLGESLGLLEKAKSGKLTAANALKIIRSRPLKTPKQFAASVRASQTRAAIFKNQALVFVHGYNTNFNDAMKRATQLAFDLQFDGIVMPFTWPSQGKVSGYLTDVSHAEQSVDTLVSFLDQLRDTLPEIKINLLAHSLGNKVMLNALCKIAKRKGDKAHNFAQIISAHADVSYADFEKLTSCFKDRVKGITLYVNEQDTALRLRCVGIFKCRAGNYARGYKSADVVDTTQMSGGFFRTLSKGFDHDIFVRNPLLFSDIARLILTGQRPVEKRTQEFRQKKGPKGNTYWAYDKSFDPARPLKKAAAK